jgi:adenine-specific DNA-methyltransferase
MIMRTAQTITPVFDIAVSQRQTGTFPNTRYQGSKYKLLNWIEHIVKDLQFETVLDAFGGTGSVSYLFKKMGKEVIYNDYLEFNSLIAKALIENDSIELSGETLNFILHKHSYISYPTFIEDTFKNIYFTDEENAWLDQTITNIRLIRDEYEQAIAYFALFQSCISKRPYNLFHRKNLYVRMAEVQRSFGNKKTWDTPFEEHFIKFVEQANGAVFDNQKENIVLNESVTELNVETPDLVYIDPPYINKNGIGVDYFQFYHFLEGLVNYHDWQDRIDYRSKHLRLKNGKSPWSDKSQITQAFTDLIYKFKDSILVISYRDDGIPSIPELITILEKVGKKPKMYHAEYKYVLSNNSSKEVLIVAE